MTPVDFSYHKLIKTKKRSPYLEIVDNFLSRQLMISVNLNIVMFTPLLEGIEFSLYTLIVRDVVLSKRVTFDRSIFTK